MTSDTVRALTTQLQHRAKSLVTAPELSTMMENIDGLAEILATLQASLANAEVAAPSAARIRTSTRDTLAHLQRALIYVESRLRHERVSLLEQLRELAAQQDWAEISRQST